MDKAVERESSILYGKKRVVSNCCVKRKSKAVKALLFLTIFLLVFYFRGENLLAAEKEEDTEFSYVDSWLDSCDL